MKIVCLVSPLQETQVSLFTYVLLDGRNSRYNPIWNLLKHVFCIQSSVCDCVCQCWWGGAWFRRRG